MVVDLDVNSCEAENADGDVARSLFTFDSTDLDAVSGKIAVVQGSECLFGTYEGGDGDYKDPYIYYLEDFQRRVDAMVSAGAIGVIWGEGRAGKIPEQMVGHLGSDSFNQDVPVCAMEKADFDAFAGYFPASPVTSIDTTNIPMYREQDERIPEPRITYLTVEEPWKPGGPNGYAFPMPAKTATFGPTAAVATEDELVEAVFVSACRSDEYEACAVNCWAPVASGTLNHPFTQSLTGKIALFASAEDEDEDDSDYGCFPHFSSWAKLAQDAGAVAIVHGTRADVSSWYYAGPYQIPFDLTIPFFSLMRPHTELLEHARDESAAHGSHDVTLQTPVIAGGAGPDFFADADVDFGLAPVLVWRDDTDHFYCDAGQAVFNPAPWAGLPLPSTGNRLVTLLLGRARGGGRRRRRVRPVHGGRRVHADRAALGARRRRFRVDKRVRDSGRRRGGAVIGRPFRRARRVRRGLHRRRVPGGLHVLHVVRGVRRRRGGRGRERDAAC